MNPGSNKNATSLSKTRKRNGRPSETTNGVRLLQKKTIVARLMTNGTLGTPKTNDGFLKVVTTRRKVAPRNFFLNLKGRLEQVGFTQSQSDQCLFISEHVICLIYVDDTLFFTPEQKYIDEVLVKLRESMELEEEDDVAGFLGVLIKKSNDGTITLTQQGLIDRIIQSLGLENTPIKLTPAEYGCLGSDKNGHGTYNYASVVGMLQYLQLHSRPDITFAVSQCARYMHSPRRSHEKALERIGQYLKATRDKGLILKPIYNGALSMEAYVDADFAGMWGYEGCNMRLSKNKRH
jgi:hypothetical protein